MSDDLFYTLPQAAPITDEQIERDLDGGHVNRLVDAYFKFAFGRPERSDMFLDLLNAIVFPYDERVFSKVEYVDREFSPERKDGKGFRLDLVGLLDGKERVNLEVQIRREAGYIKRSIYYLALLHSGQLNAGEKYPEVHRTISIHITGFPLLLDEPDFRNSYSFRNDESGKILSEDILMIFVELPKYAKQLKAGREPVNKLERWLGYLAGLEGKAMTSIAHDEPMIGRALDTERLFLMDEKQRFAYIRDFRAMMAATNHDEGIRQEALDEGRAEGKVEGKMEVAERLLELDYSIDKIALITGLSDEEVQNIANGQDRS